MPFLALPLLPFEFFLASSRPFLASSVPSLRPFFGLLDAFFDLPAWRLPVLSVLVLSLLLPQPDQTTPPATTATTAKTALAIRSLGRGRRLNVSHL